MLFYTNHPRTSASILSEQKLKIPERMETLREIKKLAYEALKYIEAGKFDDFGRLLDKGWRLKSSLTDKISNQEIDQMYQIGLDAGALGGKITGAGGGGFLLLYCPREKQYNVRSALSSFQELPFHMERDGSKVIFNYRR
jgi:D-glycero-alpha-D-manno-heptose-7-phosphate kinase